MGSNSLLRANPSKGGDAEPRDYRDAILHSSSGPPGRQRFDSVDACGFFRQPVSSEVTIFLAP
jgi:hypothetical protein